MIFFCSRWASLLSWCNLVLSFIGWPLCNSKSFILNKSASSFKKITFFAFQLHCNSFRILCSLKPWRQSSDQPARKQNELVSAQDPEKRSNTGSNEAPIKAFTPPEACTLSHIPLLNENLFIWFIKLFIEMTQAQALAEPWEYSLKLITLDNYFGKFYMNCYHFYQ